MCYIIDVLVAEFGRAFDSPPGPPCLNWFLHDHHGRRLRRLLWLLDHHRRGGKFFKDLLGSFHHRSGVS